MELDQLRLFVKVAASESLSRASVELELTQSALSKRLAALETDLDSRLFHRTGRGLKLTHAGQTLLPGATAILQEAAALRASLKQAGASASGEVYFGVLPSLTENIVGPLFDHVQRKWPSVRLVIMEGFSDALEVALGDGRLDFALLNRYGQIDTRVEEMIQSFNTFLVGPRKSPILRNPTIEVRRLHELPLVLPNRPNGLRGRLDALSRQEKITLNPVLEVDSLSAMLDAVIRGSAFTLLPRHSVLGSRRAGELAMSALAKPVVRRHVVLRRSPSRANTLAVKEVVVAARSIARQVLDPPRNAAH